MCWREMWLRWQPDQSEQQGAQRRWENQIEIENIFIVSVLGMVCNVLFWWSIGMTE